MMLRNYPKYGRLMIDSIMGHWPVALMLPNRRKAAAEYEENMVRAETRMSDRTTDPTTRVYDH
eukprot:1743096-Ditylum_brightwellii.AAC.1